MSPRASSPPAGIERFADVPVTVEARLEDRMMELTDIRAIDMGSVIPLHRSAGDTLDVFVGNVHFASAEVIVIEDRLALRITEFRGLQP